MAVQTSTLAATDDPIWMQEPRDRARFDRIMEYLSHWRNEDHQDSITIYRTDIIEIIEGVKELRLVTERILSRQNLSNRAEA